MGTRAVIRFGETRIATHWDGYPAGLGAALLQAKPQTVEELVNVVSQYTIDCATKDVIDLEQDRRFEMIAQRANEILSRSNNTKRWTSQELKDLYYHQNKILSFTMMTPEDYPIDDFSYYDDFAEWEYDIVSTKPFKVRVRKLITKNKNGRLASYREALEVLGDKGWKTLTPALCTQR